MLCSASELADGAFKAAHVTIAHLNEYPTYFSKPCLAEKSFIR